MNRTTTGLLRLHEALRTGSCWLARIAGLLLIGVALLTAGGVVLGLMGVEARFSPEIAGYTLAVVSSWAFAHALHERAHVRIEWLLHCTPRLISAWLDSLAALALAITGVVMAGAAAELLLTSYAGQTRANTPLQTPLAAPQALWVFGMIWFSVNAVVQLAVQIAITVNPAVARS